MSDWRSYDGIADRYDRVWSPRFEPAARRLWELIAPRAGDSVLDIGTGTGIVPKTLPEAIRMRGLVAGCDRAVGMLRQARAHVRGLRVVAADAACLPFRHESFGVVTASFVLSHVSDYRKALGEMERVLKASGMLAVTSWGPAADPYSMAWSDCLAGAITQPEVERASATVTPREVHFSQPGALEAALSDAGLQPLRSESVTVESEFTVDQFLEDRAGSSGGRLGRHLLGSEAWKSFLAATRDAFENRFGTSFRYRRDALVAIGRKPA